MRDSEIEAIIEALHQIQAARHLSLKGLAHLLGFSAGHLSMIFAGQRRPGLRFVRAAVERFEQVRRVVAEGLASSEGEDRER